MLRAKGSSDIPLCCEAIRLKLPTLNTFQILGHNSDGGRAGRQILMRDFKKTLHPGRRSQRLNGKLSRRVLGLGKADLGVLPVVVAQLRLLARVRPRSPSIFRSHGDQSSDCQYMEAPYVVAVSLSRHRYQVFGAHAGSFHTLRESILLF